MSKVRVRINSVLRGADAERYQTIERAIMSQVPAGYPRPTALYVLRVALASYEVVANSIDAKVGEKG